MTKIHNPVQVLLREWWLVLALLALGLLPMQMLRVSYVQNQQLLHQTISSLNDVSESRRRLAEAYLIHSRRSLDDPTFDNASAVAELRAAEYALSNWVRDQNAVRSAHAFRSDSVLSDRAAAYGAALGGVQEVLAEQPVNSIELRARYSGAEQSASALQMRIQELVTTAVGERQRAYRFLVTGWALLLLVSLLGAFFTRRALTHSEDREQATRSRLARLQKHAPVGIVESDHEGRVLAANPAWCTMTRRRERKWIGRLWWDAFEEVDRERIRRRWLQISAEDDVTAQVHLRTGQGAEGRSLLVRAAAGAGIANEDRILTFTDITEQRLIEDQLHHAQRMEAVGRLAGGVAHDFNNLLTCIRGFAALALESGKAGELKEDLVEVVRAADRGHTLTRQLLTFSRKDRIQPQVLDARNVVTDLGRMLIRMVPETVELQTLVGTRPATVLIDKGQLEQVVTNLIINSADAMDGRGTIRISVDDVRVEDALAAARSAVEPGDYVLLSVSDKGPGIPEEIREQIFDPFFTTKEQGKGTGLGLSTVWGIVRQSGGHIHVYSDPGQGTVFKIYLPVAPGHNLFEASGSDEQVTEHTPAGTALVVEDEEAVRRLTCKILELRGWKVLPAATGLEALDVVAGFDGRIDLIVTDLMMRGMSGVEFVQRLRERGIEIPTLFVSGYADSEVDLNGGHFLEKPFTPSALIRSVTAVLQNGSASAASGTHASLADRVGGNS